MSGADLSTAENLAQFFLLIAGQMNQWMGNLFFRNEPTTAIKLMGFKEMKEWNGWHKIMEKAEIKANQPKEKK